MKVLFICKASTEIGFGHLVRSMTVANTCFESIGINYNCRLKIIGDPSLSNLLSEVAFPFEFIHLEDQLISSEKYDFVFFDILEIGDEVFQTFRASGATLISLSPVFNQLYKVDVLFHRSKYINVPERSLPETVYSGLEYTVIRDNCKKIHADSFKRNLSLKNLPIAISMGGGDAANKTLEIIMALRDCKVPVTFWVALGEGYSHSYDKLIREVKGHKTHEIILARTNKSMWHILNNCALAILLSGITAYESVYAGLPSLLYYANESQSVLVNELFELNVAIDMGVYNEENLGKLNASIEKLYDARVQLFEMHLCSKDLIKRNGSIDIIETLKSLHDHG